jgi:hypothetical protein
MIPELYSGALVRCRNDRAGVYSFGLLIRPLSDGWSTRWIVLVDGKEVMYSDNDLSVLE